MYEMKSTIGEKEKGEEDNFYRTLQSNRKKSKSVFFAHEFGAQRDIIEIWKRAKQLELSESDDDLLSAIICCWEGFQLAGISFHREMQQEEIDKIYFQMLKKPDNFLHLKFMALLNKLMLKIIDHENVIDSLNKFLKRTTADGLLMILANMLTCVPNKIKIKIDLFLKRNKFQDIKLFFIWCVFYLRTSTVYENDIINNLSHLEETLISLYDENNKIKNLIKKLSDIEDKSDEKNILEFLFSMYKFYKAINIESDKKLDQMFTEFNQALINGINIASYSFVDYSKLKDKQAKEICKIAVVQGFCFGNYSLFEILEKNTLATSKLLYNFYQKFDPIQPLTKRMHDIKEKTTSMFSLIKVDDIEKSWNANEALEFYREQSSEITTYFNDNTVDERLQENKFFVSQVLSILNKLKQTPLHFIFSGKNYEVINHLLSLANQKVINNRDIYGETTFFGLFFDKDSHFQPISFNSFKLLLEAGANLEVASKFHNSVHQLLIVSAKDGNEKSLELLAYYYFFLLTSPKYWTLSINLHKKIGCIIKDNKILNKRINKFFKIFKNELVEIEKLLFSVKIEYQELIEKDSQEINKTIKICWKAYQETLKNFNENNPIIPQAFKNINNSYDIGICVDHLELLRKLHQLIRKGIQEKNCECFEDLFADQFDNLTFIIIDVLNNNNDIKEIGLKYFSENKNKNINFFVIHVMFSESFTKFKDLKQKSSLTHLIDTNKYIFDTIFFIKEMQKLELSENAVNIVAENKGLIESLEELAKSGCALASYYCYYYLKFNAEMPRNAEICLKQSLIQGGVLIEKIKQTYLETVTEIKEILVIEKIFYGLDPTGISKEMLKNITKSKSYFPKPDFSYISVIEVVELLIQFININQLMDINQINQENGCTLSHYIFATEDESAILKLLKTKANINIQDVDGNTALHFLFIKNVLEAGKESLNNLSLALIQAIFETNADLTIQNQNNISIINLLIKALTGVKSDEKEYAINIVALMYVIREEKVQTIFNIIEKDPYLKDEFYQKCWMFKINQKNIGSEENNRSFRP